MAYDPTTGLINGANLVGGLINQGRKTEDYVNGLFDAHAKMKAGEAVARGDYGAASGLLGARGMVDDAEALRSRGTTTKALKAADSGDYAGATAAAAEGGDAKLYGGLQDQEAAERKDKAAWMGHAADALLQVPDPQKRHEIFQSSIAPTLKAMGLKDEQIASIDQQSLSNEGLNAFKASLGTLADENMQFFQTPDGRVLGVNKKTGEKKLIDQSGEKPAGEHWVEVKNADGSTTYKDLNAEAPRASGEAPAGLQQLAELGVKTTSGLRTPEHNAEVGGVPGSHHLNGTARDLVPPQGMTMAELEAHARQAMPGAKVLNEGDHVHVQWDGGGQRTAAGDAPQSKEKSAPSGYEFKADGSLTYIKGGPADPATKTSAGLKPVPAKTQQGYAENNSAIGQIDAAIAAIRKNPGAMGLKNFAGDNITQRMDPGGVAVRAAVANIGSLKRHERSGAAVTAAETPALQPFIPTVTDRADAAITKLQSMKDQYRSTQGEFEASFGEDTGYRPISGSAPAASAKPSAPKPGQVVKGYRFNGGDPSKPSSWAKVS